MKELISCLNSPALLNQKIALQFSHITEPAASKPASKEHLREFHWEQDSENTNTQEEKQSFFYDWTLWLKTFIFILFMVLITPCIFQIKANDRRIQAALL